jgi:hypothetical protein
MRLEQMDYVIKNLDSRVLIGNGPSKGIKDVFEIQYILYLFRYGLLGLFFTITIIFLAFFYSKKVYNIYRNKMISIKEIAFYKSFYIWSTILFIASFGNVFIEQIRISYFFYFNLGYMIYLTHMNKIRGGMKDE